MATDPFDGIKKPICGEFIEIGQPTFVELISAKNCTTSPAIGRSAPDVSIALNQLAFGKPCTNRLMPSPSQNAPIFSDISTNRAPAAGFSSYSIRKVDKNGKSSAQKIRNLGAAKSTVEFRKLVTNVFSDNIRAFDVLSGCPGECPDPCVASDGDLCAVDLCVVLDTTGSMTNQISQVKTGIDEVAQFLSETVGNNYRLSLVTFGDHVFVETPFSNLCGAASLKAFKTALAPISACWRGDCGNYVEEWSAKAVQDASTGVAGCWREGNVVRALILITDAPNNDYESEPASGVSVTEAAMAAQNCGIRVAYAGSPGIAAEGAIYASLTSGVNVVLSSSGDGLKSLLQTFIYSLCAKFIQAPECAGGIDLVLNGTFESDINGWETDGIVVWDDDFESSVDLDQVSRSARLDKGASMQQEFSGLEPGSLILMNYNWCLGQDITVGTETQTIIGELRDSLNIALPLLEGSAPASYEAIVGDCSTDRNTRPPVKVRVPADGIVRAYFELSDMVTPNTHLLYLDQIVVCNLVNDDCGPGARNLVRNGNFELGVEEWTDKNDVAISPTTDPNIWDDNILAIIINISEENEVRQTLTDLTSGQELTLSFEVTSNEPDTISEVELDYGILSSSNGIIKYIIVANAAIQPTPTRLTVSFTVPSDGIVKIFFKTGTIGGVTKIRNVLVCDNSGTCEEGFDRISYDEFETNKGSWSGGTYDSINKHVLLDDVSNTITQTFPGLEPGSLFQLSVNVKNTGGVIITLFSDTEAGQIITPTAPGYYTTTVTVQSNGLVVATIQKQGSTVNVDDILTCISLPESCDGSVNNVQILIEWDGIARTPVNMFNALVRYTIRNPDDPFDVTEITYAASSEGRLSITTCDIWKSQIASGNVLGTGISNIGLINSGDFGSVATKADWLWSIPQNNISGAQDNLVINFQDPGPGMLVENIQVLLLANNAVPATGTNTAPVNPAPLGCSEDPATRFNVILKYVNSQGLNREFIAPILKSDIWAQEVDFSVGNPWDTNSATGNGIKGSSARWESVEFNLDTVDGRGLDQCTRSLTFRGEASGNIAFKKITLKGTGLFIDPCLSEVLVEDISDGSAVNEIQSIILPNPTGGTWDLSFTRLGDEDSTTLAWNTTAAQIRNRLGAFTSIGDKNNVIVTGAGTAEDPFLIEFVNDLGAIDQNLFVANGLNLTGSAPASVITLTNGTLNEQQTISNPDGVRQDLIINFMGTTSFPLPYGATLNEMSSALEGMATIGIGNVSVTGSITDRDTFYSGPYHVLFIGALGEQNVPEMTVGDYKIVTDWNGGFNGGHNEAQTLNLVAFGGTFAVRVFNEDSSAFANTTQIAYNSTAAAVKAAIVTAANFIADTDLIVTSIEANAETGLFVWKVEFIGAYLKTDMPQMQMNATGLTGSSVIVTELQTGSGANERQRLTILNASGGSFKLTVTINGINYKTTAIPWNTTAAGLQIQLIALLPFVDGDVTVSDLPITRPEQNLRVAIVFKKKFGNIPLMIPNFQTTLLCDPIILVPVDPGPYKYPIPNCDEIDNDLGCSSGPLLCRPGSSDASPSILVPCCDENTIPDIVNVSTRIKLERDLFDPSQPRTIRELALIKGLKPSNYTPYIRDFSTNNLTETSYNVTISTKMSILLVENELNTTNGRRRILNHIAGHREILPARFTWPDCDVVTPTDFSKVCWPGAS